ncbi:MAG TPA: AGE family epimerase/isomerase [Puia sp.]|nr:AGE family epimerase/isomerase [Puia sp.]
MDKAVYRKEVTEELSTILRYWMEKMPDEHWGGFFGRVDGEDRVHPDAPKGLVLNSRILWAFSAGYHMTGEASYRKVAQRAYEYLAAHFIDKQYGGAFWSLSADGQPLEDRKQIYGQAFCLYGYCEYHIATGDRGALREAIGLFRAIEQYSRDHVRNGYYEAFTRDWQSLDDQRLSAKDANEKKTMNTHLHLLEAYTNLYRSWPDPLLRERLKDLLEVFDLHMINADTGHLVLFSGDDWSPRSGIASYGHDIEAAWLLQEAAIVIGDEHWMERTRSLALLLAGAAAEGLDADGGLWYEREEGGPVPEKHWWPQAEAMVGFWNAAQVSGSEIWEQRSIGSWVFIKKYIRDPAGREWYWGVGADHRPMPGQDKAGFWKCPYHNSRACLEMMRRLESRSA